MPAKNHGYFLAKVTGDEPEGGHVKSHVYEKLEQFFERNSKPRADAEGTGGPRLPHLVSFAKCLRYSEANIAILEAEIEDSGRLQAQYPEVYANLLTCAHQRDNRTPLEYGQDLVASWVFEDVFYRYLRDRLPHSGMNVKLSGADRRREILSSANVSASSDYLLSFNGRDAYLELVNDYHGYWAKNLQCDLRDSKWDHLCRLASPDRPSLLLGLDLTNNKYFLMNVRESQDVRFLPSHLPYGGKPAYSISLRNRLRDFTFGGMLAALQGELA